MMRLPRSLRVLVCSVLLFGYAAFATAAVRLPAVIGDHMVLQRGQTVPIWGWADAGENVTVTFLGQTKSALPGADGKWMLRLDALAAGGPHTMIVTGKNTITLQDILVGEVWLGSGQSNMELSVAECNNASQEIAAAEFPRIRLLTVPAKGTQEPQHDFQGRWVLCSPKTVPHFSAAAYYFGRKVQQELNVPVGLIHCSWGASSCEAWINRSVLTADPQYRPLIEDWDQRMQKVDPAKAADGERQYNAWRTEVMAAKAAGREPPKPPRNLGEMFRVMFEVRRRPANCYNGMLLPLIPYAMRGVLWYQGETNAERACQYRQLFPLMIRHWRDTWGQGDFPFYFVQLANFLPIKPQPSDSTWAELREAQTMTLRTPNTGMAVTIDIGDAKDIHPRNKQDVGNRLALWALAKTYGKTRVYSGPLYRSMEKQGCQIVVRFDHCGAGLASKDNAPLTGFAIAGADKKFVWAEARLAGDRVIVRSPDVTDPVAVRYAWADNPVCNLYNREGLPASPFRTDDWPGLTANKVK